MVEVSVILAAKDEEESLERLLPDIVNAMGGYSHEIIVVDDGSRDKTAQVARKHGARVISHKNSKGKSVALRNGFMAATGEILVMFDADYQEEPKEIPLIVEKVKSGYDIVNGWRRRRKDAFMKKIQSEVYNTFVFALTLSPLHDHNCPLKAFRKEMRDKLDLNTEGYHRYMVLMLRKKGFKVGEFEVTHYPRKAGKSKFGHLGRLLEGFKHLIKLKSQGMI